MPARTKGGASWQVEQERDTALEAGNVVHLDIRPLFPRARLLRAVAAGPEQHSAHPQEFRGDDVVVDAVADYGVDAEDRAR